MADLTLPKIGTSQAKLLERLCSACAVSGDEGEVRKIVIEEIKAHADSYKVDALGNVLATRSATKAGPNPLRVLLAAHMDEVGFMVSADDKDGFYRFELIGGLDPTILIAKPVAIGKDHLTGVIGAKPIHLTTAAERKTAITLESLRIDTGNGGNGKVKVGDHATFAPNFTTIGQGAGRSFRSKALDDRIGVANLIELVKNPPPNVELLAAFTVQEEVGLRGAEVAAYTFDPDIAIALDCTPALDLPPYHDDDENTRYNTQLDAGPAIYTVDKGTLSDPRLVRHFTETGDALGIPYQYRQPGGGGTDAAAMHKARAGIPSLSVSVPGRYLHTPHSLVRFADWQNTLRLVYASLARLTGEVLEMAR
ncbi:MAG: M42 family peptidase [Anaerolineales bacterium]|nr:M42 family peptidase [Anaerolineales bacterium]